MPYTKNPTSYLGVKSGNPPNMFIKYRRPTINDIEPFNMGDFWVIPKQKSPLPSEEVWEIVGMQQNQASWVQLNASESTVFLNHQILVGTGTTTIGQLPLGTVGQALLSGGASADPSWGVLTVPSGGTGATSLTGVLIGNGTSAITANPITQYDVLIGGASNAITSVSPSTANYVLTSNGTSANPSFKILPSNNGGVVVTSYTTAGSGTHTLNVNTKMVQLYMWGAGGNGTAGNSGSPYFAGSNGSAGTFLEYAAPAVFFGGGGAAISYTVGAPATGVGNPSVFGGVITVLSSLGNIFPNSTPAFSSSNLTVNTGGSSGYATFYNGASLASFGGGGGDYTIVPNAGGSPTYGSGASASLGGAAGTSGVDGGPGLDGTTIVGSMFGGGGGGGGYGGSSGAASAGGNGGKPGGGGGAGGSVLNVGGAAGGLGADGAIYVVEYLG